jgi:hypothetical protein
LEGDRKVTNKREWESPGPVDAVLDGPDGATVTAPGTEPLDAKQGPAPYEVAKLPGWIEDPPGYLAEKYPLMPHSRVPDVSAQEPGKRPRVSVVVPARNEARNLPYVMAHLPAGIFEVVLVDGHSADDTVAVAEKLYPGVRIIQDTRRGKGNALACGFAAARGDIIVTLDADGSTDGLEIPRFVAALLEGADFVKGSRFLPGAGSSDITRVRGLGNRALTMLVNFLFGTKYTDLCYGFNAFWARCLPALNVDCDGFEVETLINIRVAKAGFRVREVASFEGRRLHGVSNLNAFRDGRRVLRTIVEERWPVFNRAARRPVAVHELSAPVREAPVGDR